jgi:hypothetical protein
MDMGYSCGQMEVNTKDFGRMVCSKDKDTARKAMIR